MQNKITVAVLVGLGTIGSAARGAVTQEIDGALVTAKDKIRSAQYRDAEQLYRNILKRIGNPKPPTQQLGTALNGLATVMQMTGRLPEAEKLYKRAIDAEERSHGTASALNAIRNNLASLYYHLNRLEDAENLHRQVLEERERVSGPNSAATAITLNNLAEVVRFRGRSAEARPFAERSVAILGTYPDVNSQVLLSDSLHTLGRVCVDLGALRDAAQAFERSRTIRENTLGPKHPKVAESLLALAGVHTSERQLDEAEHLILAALPILEQAEVRSSTAIAYNNLAQVYKLAGRYTDAEPLYRRAIAIWTQSGDVKNPNYALTLSAYADMLRCDGRIEGALQTYAQALTLAERQLGPNHPDTVGIRQGLAALRTSLIQARSTVSAQSLRAR